ncbi:MAG: sigma-70 family RNA polymerase sigma factor [Acidobacteriota bacterium]|nr:sigma-70 family RNA polymerase sigma factor [Acidobacteriota bacterium]
MTKEPYTDEDCELVARCRKGDSLAFEELVRKYQQTILNLAYHYLGYQRDFEDVAQKIFTKVYFSLPKFDTRRPFFPWLYRIAVNQCYDELRRMRRAKVRTFSELSTEETNSVENLISQPDVSISTDEERREMFVLLQKLLAQLPDQQRMAIVLRDIEDISYSKMAEMLKCTEQAARLKVFRARARLKTLVDKALKSK